jgi:hypothetical protein
MLRRKVRKHPVLMSRDRVCEGLRFIRFFVCVHIEIKKRLGLVFDIGMKGKVRVASPGRDGDVKTLKR